MSTTRKIHTLFALLLAALALLTTSAHAATRKPYPITQYEHKALAAARVYWRTSPEGAHTLPCAAPAFRVEHEAIEGAAAWVLEGCTVYLSAQWVSERPAYPELCQAIVHELGHLILGPTYFEATDPSNPSHSANPRNVMYPFPTVENMPSECGHVKAKPAVVEAGRHFSVES